MIRSRSELGWELPIRTETGDNQPNFVFSMTPPADTLGKHRGAVSETLFSGTPDTSEARMDDIRRISNTERWWCGGGGDAVVGRHRCLHLFLDAQC